ATASAFLHFRALHPQFSSPSTNDSRTALQSRATSLFAASFRHLLAAHSTCGTRHSDSVRRAFLYTSRRLILSTSTHQHEPSVHQMGVCPMNPQTPNHALQRTAPRVTVAADSGSCPSRPSVAISYARGRFLRSTTQLPRHAPPSLSLGSLGDL